MRSYTNCEYLEAKRLEAIKVLRSVNKYTGDANCSWKPRTAAKTDVAKTWSEAKRREERT